MPSSGSVMHWLAVLKAGDSAAAGPLGDRYFRRLDCGRKRCCYE
jgi:hypothetical protein